MLGTKLVSVFKAISYNWGFLSRTETVLYWVNLQVKCLITKSESSKEYYDVDCVEYVPLTWKFGSLLLHETLCVLPFFSSMVPDQQKLLTVPFTE